MLDSTSPLALAPAPMAAPALEEAMSPAMRALERLMSAQNVAALKLPAKVLNLEHLGQLVCTEYKIDRDSMSDWLDQAERGQALAKLTKKEKNYPFPGASNVKFPLLASAILQFNARAYPAVIGGDRIVKARPEGADHDGAKADQGERVSEYMSYQLRREVREWVEETDKLTAILPNAGTVARKIWWDGAQKRLRVRTCPVDGFIVHNRVKTLDDAPRISDRFALYPSEIAERVASGDWLPDANALDEDAMPENRNDDGADAQDTVKPREFIEQHRRIDLDGDGYPEPYVVTVHRGSEKVVRIVADYEPQDVQFADRGARVASIRRNTYFVTYHFLPSLDGRFFSPGFAMLLGDISETIDTLLNMMIDAGHYAALGGGFIGADAKMKGGAHNRRPGDWTKLPIRGQAIKDAIVPLTFPQPDATLFQVLGLLIEEARRLTGVSEVMTGDTGNRQLAATTTLALIEQGMQQFNAANKRIFRSFEQEFQLIAKLNARYLSPQKYSAFFDRRAKPQPIVDQMTGQPVMDPATGQPAMLPPQPQVFDPVEDFDLTDMDISLVADPDTVTSMQKLAKAQLIRELAADGLADPMVAAQRVLEAAAVPDRDELKPPQPDPETQDRLIRAQEAEIAEKTATAKERDASAARHQADTLERLAALDRPPTDDSGPAMALEALKAQVDVAKHRLSEEMDLLNSDRQRAYEAQALLIRTAQEPESDDKVEREDMAATLLAQQAASAAEQMAVVEQATQNLETLLAQLVAATAAPRRLIRDDAGNAVGAVSEFAP